MRTTRTATAAAVGGVTLLAAFTLAGCGGSGDASPGRAAQQAAAPDSAVPTINVAGRGEVEGTPDLVTVTIGVETRDPSAQAALELNNQRAAMVIDTLKGKGVAAKDIQTSNLSVYPNWDDKQNITGYTVANTVTVRLRDVKNAGAVIDAAASTAGNDIRLHGVQFSIDDTSDLVSKARTEAVKDAMAQAKELAGAAGVTLGPIRRIDTTGTAPPPPLYYAGRAAEAALDRAAVPLEPGSQELTVDVNVVFEIVS
jgi:hypothetical protein